MKQVNIMIGRFQPITNGHMKCIDAAWNKLGIPTIIAMINTKDEKVDEKHPFPSSLLLPLYEDVFKKNNRIEKIILVRNANIVEIGETLYNDGYEIKSWTCGTDRVDSYKKMSDKYHNEAHLSDDFQIIEVKRSDEDISATKARQALVDDDRKLFSALTPLMTIKSRITNNVYDKLRNQLLKVLQKQ
jgi:nicotinic acid mononucleotide adenylyltransferase